MGAFWDAWDKQDQLRNQAAQSQIQQATGLAGLMGQVQAQQRAQQVQSLLSDPNIAPEQKRMGLMGLIRDPVQAANVMHQIETEKANAALRTAQMDTQKRLLAEAERRAARETEVRDAQRKLQGMLAPDVSPTDGAQRTPFVGSEAELVQHMQKNPGVYTRVDPAQVRSLAAIIDPNDAIKSLIKPTQRVVTPGSTVLGPNGEIQFQAPFAPRTEPAPQIVPTPNGPAILPRGSDTLSPIKNPDGSTAAPPKPVDLSPMQKATFNAGLKEVAADEKAAAAASDVENAIKRWQELNAKVLTGPVTGRRPISFDSDYQELKRLENFLAVNNFKPGQGQISNFERELIKGAGPMTANNKDTNENIVKIMLGGVQNMRDKAQFKEWYLEQNKKTLGADKAWQEYVNKNPRFTRDAKGNIVENPDRVDWSAYFVGNAPTAPATPAPAASGGWSVKR